MNETQNQDDALDRAIGEIFFPHISSNKWNNISGIKKGKNRAKKEKELHSTGRSDEDMKPGKGRMINKAISDSDKFASLSPEAAVLFCMMIPHYNARGKLNGGSGYIKDEVCPKINYLTFENIPKLLQEISDKTNVKYFPHNGRFWIQSLNFLKEHQELKLDRMGPDSLPNYPQNTTLVTDKSGIKSGEVLDSSDTTNLEEKQQYNQNTTLVTDKSGIKSGIVRSEVEVEVEVEVEGEGEGEGEGAALGNVPKPPYGEIIKYLNDKTASNFSPTRKDTQRFINARWKEKRTLDDFKKVIDTMFIAWGNDEKMKNYLQPSTLFSPKFENYLNFKIRSKKNVGQIGSGNTSQSQRTTQDQTTGGKATPGKYSGLGEEIIIK